MTSIRGLPLRIWRALFDSQAQISTDGLWAQLSFDEVDLGALKTSLRLAERAQENGRKDLPALQRTDLDPVEREIAETFEKLKKNDFEKHLVQQRIRRRQIADFDFHTVETRIDSVVKDVRAKYLSLKRRCLDELFRSKQDCKECASEFQEFRRTHDLRRPADYPESKIWHGGILLVILLLEAYLNGTFLAKGNEEGLLGGVSYALIFAAINIALAWANGRWFVTRWHHHRYSVRLVAMLLTFGCASASFAFNLLVAHYREAVALGPTASHEAVLRDFLASPFALTDIESLMLFFGGLIFAIVAAGDGYRWDDPYPGYGRRDRRVREKERDYTTLKAEVSDEIEELRERATRELDRLVEEIDQQRSTQHRFCQLRDSESRQFQLHVEYLERACNRLLGEYRAINRETRSSPVPAYFEQPWRFHDSEAGGRDSDLDQNLDASLGRCLKLISEARDSVHTAHRETLDEFKQLEDLVTDEGPRLASA
jgi:hypothetical protein